MGETRESLMSHQSVSDTSSIRRTSAITAGVGDVPRGVHRNRPIGRKDAACVTQIKRLLNELDSSDVRF